MFLQTDEEAGATWSLTRLLPRKAGINAGRGTKEKERRFNWGANACDQREYAGRDSVLGVGGKRREAGELGSAGADDVTVVGLGAGWGPNEEVNG